MNSIESAVSAWPGVEVDSHDRGGGREFTLDGREIGHIHRGKLVDIPFAKRVRDILIAEERAEKHHVMPDSGWDPIELNRTKTSREDSGSSASRISTT